LCIGINLAIVSVLQALSKIIAYDLLLFNYAINLATIYDVLAIIQLLVSCYFAATHHLAFPCLTFVAALKDTGSMPVPLQHIFCFSNTT